MSMTENEAIKKIRCRINTASKIAGKGEDGKAFEDLEMAMRALTEIQQIKKEIIEDFGLDCGSTVLNVEEIWHQLKYLAIDTIEKFKALKEKNEPKKATFDNTYEIYICPSCGKSVGEHQNYCWNCGQALET